MTRRELIAMVEQAQRRAAADPKCSHYAIARRVHIIADAPDTQAAG